VVGSTEDPLYFNDDGKVDLKRYLENIDTNIKDIIPCTSKNILQNTRFQLVKHLLLNLD
jgi:hypothetical protein